MFNHEFLASLNVVRNLGLLVAVTLLQTSLPLAVGLLASHLGRSRAGGSNRGPIGLGPQWQDFVLRTTAVVALIVIVLPHVVGRFVSPVATVQSEAPPPSGLSTVPMTYIQARYPKYTTAPSASPVTAGDPAADAPIVPPDKILPVLPPPVSPLSWEIGRASCRERVSPYV